MRTFGVRFIDSIDKWTPIYKVLISIHKYFRDNPRNNDKNMFNETAPVIAVADFAATYSNTYIATK